MKVIYWWELSSDESYLVMSDGSYLVMEVKIVKEVKRRDGLWRFACGDVWLVNSNLSLIPRRVTDSWTSHTMGVQEDQLKAKGRQQKEKKMENLQEKEP